MHFILSLQQINSYTYIIITDTDAHIAWMLRTLAQHQCQLYNRVSSSSSVEPASDVELSLSLLETISTSFLVVLADLAGMCRLTAVDGSIAFSQQHNTHAQHICNRVNAVVDSMHTS